jgi:tetratricopeptide (TPR) repeat protein
VTLLFLSSVLCAPDCLGQSAKPASSAAATSALAPERAIELAERGQCREAVSALKKSLATADRRLKKKAGIAGLRCALTLDDRDAAVQFLQILGRDFSKDPEALYVVVHAFSDLSTRAAQDLARTAPQSIQALELNAEAMEVQSKWDEALAEYRKILEQDQKLVGIHYRIGRVLLSKPEPSAGTLQEAKLEMQRELEIDPRNAGAEYVIGQLAVQSEQWPEAIDHFSRAAKLDESFGDAFLGWGFCLVTTKQYEAAVAPLRTAVRLQPGNPAAHYNLGTALSRLGKKEEAEKEFAIHRQLTGNSGTSPQTKE